MDELMTVKEVQDLLKISRWTVRRLDRVGALKPIVIGKIKRYRRSDIDALIKSSTSSVK